MIPICQSKFGAVYLDSNMITREVAIEIAEKLLGGWGQVHPKVTAKVLYEAEPKTFSECPHYESLKDALEQEGYNKQTSPFAP